MKPRDRTINIFNLSMLDVISGALGAFLVIMIILMPYYNKENIDYRREIDQLRQQLSDIRFLIVSIQWTAEKEDLDLHVEDPSGAEFYYDRPTVPGRPGELTEDDVEGPGKETWEILSAPPGVYRVYASLYDRHGNPEDPQVETRLFSRDGVKELASVRLTREREKKLLVTATVQPDGAITFQLP